MPITQGLEIRDTLGNQAAIITDYYEGEWSQGVNVADQLRFVVPTATAPASMIHDNEIWLRRGDTASLVRKFVISDMIVRQGHRDETEVICYDYISLLGRVAVTEVPDPSLAGTDVNVLQYLHELLALQSEITWGTLPPIASDLTYPYDDLFVANTYVLPSLHRLRDYIGGMLWVDNDKKLHWYKKRFPNPPQSYTLELGRNTISIKRRDNRLHDSAEISYDVEVVDLSQESGEDDGMLNIGMPVTLDGTTLYITDIKQYLGNPLALTIGVSTSLNLSGRPPDMLDYLVAQEQRLYDLERYRDLYDNKFDGLNTDIDELETDLADLEVELSEDLAVIGTDIDQLEADGIEYDGRLDDLEAGLHLVYGSNIQDVGDENSEGTSNLIARSNHVHKGLTGVDMVAVLPAIPTEGARSVIWGTSTQISGGTGDGYKWTACEGYTKWKPDHNYTTLSGEVV